MSNIDKDYFDAKFDGLTALVKVSDENLRQHVIAVSGNVKKVAEDLAAHKESSTAHGAGVIIAWVGILISVAGVAAVFLKK